jgi:hypothetical protein
MFLGAAGRKDYVKLDNAEPSHTLNLPLTFFRRKETILYRLVLLCAGYFENRFADKLQWLRLAPVILYRQAYTRKWCAGAQKFRPTVHKAGHVGTHGPSRYAIGWPQSFPFQARA